MQRFEITDFPYRHFWHAGYDKALMVGVWLLFAALLFVIEPLALGRLVRRRAAAAPEATLALMLWLHRGMLILSLAAVFAAVGGSHGLF